MSRVHGAVVLMREFHRRFDRYIFPLVILIAFLFDEWKFRHLSLAASGILIFSYFVLIGVCIYFLHFFDRKKIHGDGAKLIIPWLPVAIQYGFGGLFGAYLVFYLRSTPLGLSAFFILLLIGILIASEVSRKKFFRLDLQMGMFFVSLFLYLFFVLSVVQGRVGTVPFLWSSVLSAGIILLFLFLLWPMVSEKFHRLKFSLLLSLSGIFVLLNLLYFLNLIPPIPLVLKDIGVFYRVVPNGQGGYLAYKEAGETEGSSLLFLDRSMDIYITSGNPVYVFSSIFAPKNVDTKIFHVWQHYDEQKKTWTTTDRIAFQMTGGREDGYRGYTMKSSVAPGQWRVNVVTQNDSLIGRVSFHVDRTEVPVSLEVVNL
ncbi:MAG TPA: DUF2914 domain-containing protein [Candidatus Paceibacterota bacterium]|nr:DUF2914 domain-containing protein [Candidatus Paceibacterota bacterium]